MRPLRSISFFIFFSSVFFYAQTKKIEILFLVQVYYIFISTHCLKTIIIMPNAKTITSSNNQNTANPSERLSGLAIFAIRMCMITTQSSIEREECHNRLREYYENYEYENYENRLRDDLDLANRQDPNPNDELLRFSEDDIDSNIDSDSDNDLPGLNDDV